MCYVNALQSAITENDRYDGVSDLISEAFAISFKKDIDQKALKGYVDLYTSRKIMPIWVVPVLFLESDLSVEDITAVVHHNGAILFLSDDEISKCDNCGAPIVYSVHRVKGVPNEYFCSLECTTPPAIVEVSEVA